MLTLLATKLSLNYRTQPTTDLDDIDDTADASITAEDLQEECKFLVFESCLMSLLSQCSKCGQEVESKTSVRGTLLVVTGSCPHGHEVHWQSQPTVRNMAAGNLLVPAAILFSGLTFTAFASMARTLNLPMIAHLKSFIPCC